MAKDSTTTKKPEKDLSASFVQQNKDLGASYLNLNENLVSKVILEDQHILESLQLLPQDLKQTVNHFLENHPADHSKSSEASAVVPPVNSDSTNGSSKASIQDTNSHQTTLLEGTQFEH